MAMAGRTSAPWDVRAVAMALVALGSLQAALGFKAALGFIEGAHGGSHSATAPIAGAALRGARATMGAPAVEVFSNDLVALPGSPGTGLFCGAFAAALAGVMAKMAMRHGSVAQKATRTEWYRKVKRVGGDQALFDVVIPKPMGVKMQKFPQKDGIGILEIVKGGNTDELNRRVCVDEDPGMWVLEGDRVMAVNDRNAEEATIEDIIQLVGLSGDTVKLTLLRNTRKGPIKVVMMPEGQMAVVRRNARLSCAAEYAAGKELKYGCIDGWCGTCWHRERSTNGIFKPCCDVLTGDWDNVMPLVLTPKPEKAGDSTFLNPRGS